MNDYLTELPEELMSLTSDYLNDNDYYSLSLLNKNTNIKFTPRLKLIQKLFRDDCINLLVNSKELFNEIFYYMYKLYYCKKEIPTMIHDYIPIDECWVNKYDFYDCYMDYKQIMNKKEYTNNDYICLVNIYEFCIAKLESIEIWKIDIDEIYNNLIVKYTPYKFNIQTNECPLMLCGENYMNCTCIFNEL